MIGDANIAAKTSATSYSTYKTSEGITSPSNTSKQGATSANIEAKTSYKYYNNNSSISDVAASVEEENINAGLDEPIPILYSDDDIIVVNKPAFAQTAPGYLEKDCAAARIADIFGISRIDQVRNISLQPASVHTYIHTYIYIYIFIFIYTCIYILI